MNDYKPNLVPLGDWYFKLSGHATRRFCKRVFPQLKTKPESIISWIKKCKFADKPTLKTVRKTHSYSSDQIVLQQHHKPFVFVAVGTAKRPRPDKVVCRIITFMVYQKDEKGRLHFVSEKTCPHCGHNPDTAPKDIIPDGVYCHHCNKRPDDEIDHSQTLAKLKKLNKITKPKMSKALRRVKELNDAMNALRAENNEKPKKLTPYQSCLIQLLRKGFKFRSHISGWTHSDRRLRVETQDALWNTKELVEITVKGKRFNDCWVCHKEHAEKIAKGRQILETKEP